MILDQSLQNDAPGLRKRADACEQTSKIDEVLESSHSEVLVAMGLVHLAKEWFAHPERLSMPFPRRGLDTRCQDRHRV